MTRQTLYSVLGYAKTPGAVTSVIWDPACISPRVRKLAEYAMRQLVCPWAYSSKTRKLMAFVMPNDVPYVRSISSWGSSIHLPHPEHHAVLRQYLHDMLKAMDVADKLLPTKHNDELRMKLQNDLKYMIEFRPGIGLSSLTHESSLVDFMRPFTVQYAAQIEQAIAKLYACEPIVLLDNFVHTRKPKAKVAEAVL